MKRSIEEHAHRFDAKASEYDEDRPRHYLACRDRVIDAATPRPSDTVLDLGTGTGAIALALAPNAREVIGRDISSEMLAIAAEKIREAGYGNVRVDEGRFRQPNVTDDVDIITSNFAMHHLNDEAKQEAITTLYDQFEPRQFVLGDLMFFGQPNPDEPVYDPNVDDPATAGRLADYLTTGPYALTAVHAVTDQVGVLVAERVGE